MSTMVKVWNDNDYVHAEVFKGNLITIPAHGHVEMDYVDACEFRGQYTPIKMITDGNPDPRAFKKIRVENPTSPIFKDQNVLHATGQVASSAGELAALAKAFAALNPDAVARAEDGPAKEETVSKSQYDDVLARLAALESQTEKRGPGRPKKEA